MSLYANYIRERLGDEILETEQGFVIYRYTDPSTVYLVDLYVLPDFRKSGVAKDLADRVADVARARGCSSMLGSVVPSARASADSIRVLLAYGMVPDSSTNDFILFKKGLT